MMEHVFMKESFEFSCAELKVICKKQEILFLKRRRPLLTFHDMYEAMENISEWCESANKHLEKEFEQEIGLEPEQDQPQKPADEQEQDVLSELRQFVFLMSRVRDIKIRGRADFEEDFDEIKDLISAKTLITVDEHNNKLEDVKKKVSERRDLLRQQMKS
jgi:hypothetical protein